MLVSGISAQDVQNKVKNILIGLIKGSIEPKGHFNFHDDFEIEQDKFNEETIIEIEGDKVSLYIEFTWNYNIDKGRPAIDYDSPKDPDVIILTSIDIKKVTFFDDYYGDEYLVPMDIDIERLIKKYLSKQLPVDEINKNL